MTGKFSSFTEVFSEAFSEAFRLNPSRKQPKRLAMAYVIPRAAVHQHGGFLKPEML